MKKFMTSAMVVALTASVSMGIPMGWNGLGDGTTWTDANNWVGGVLPGSANSAMQNSTVDNAVIVLSSSTTIGELRMGTGGTGNRQMTLVLTNGASLTSTGRVELARDRAGAGNALLMYDSSIVTTVSGAGLLIARPNAGVQNNAALTMYNSTIDLAGNLTMYDNQPLLVVTSSITMNNNSWISSAGIAAVDNGKIFINSGSYLRIRNTTSDAQIDTMISQGIFVVDGTTVTLANKNDYVEKFGGSTYVIPEPATIGMLGLGAIATLLFRRLSRRV